MKRSRGPWFHRFMIHFFTLVFGLLVFWVLGFLVEDIESIRGPQYPEVETQHVDGELVERSTALTAEILELERSILNRRDEMRIVSDSSQNLQNTINQLIELQQLSVERAVSLSESEQANLSESLAQFLETQRRYQALNRELARLTDEKQSLEAEKADVDKHIEQQRAPAREEFVTLRERHGLRLAGYQLLFLLPLLAAGAFLVVKKRGSAYFPLFLGFGTATLVKAAFVIHKYFPARYVKYVLVGGLLLAVAGLLVHFIRMVAFPGTDMLARRYREGYERFFCPVCGFPHTAGPQEIPFLDEAHCRKDGSPRRWCR